MNVRVISLLSLFLMSSIYCTYDPNAESTAVPDYSAKIAQVCAPQIEELRKESQKKSKIKPDVFFRSYSFLHSFKTFYIKENGKVDIYTALFSFLGAAPAYNKGKNPALGLHFYLDPLSHDDEDVDLVEALQRHARLYRPELDELTAYCVNEFNKLPEHGKKVIKWDNDNCIECKIQRDYRGADAPYFVCKMQVPNNVFKGLKHYDKNYKKPAEQK